MEYIGLSCGATAVGWGSFATSMLLGKVIEKLVSPLVGFETASKMFVLANTFFFIRTIKYCYSKRGVRELFTEANIRGGTYFATLIFEGAVIGTLLQEDPLYKRLAIIQSKTGFIGLLFIVGIELYNTHTRVFEH